MLFLVDYLITKDPYKEFTRLKAIGTGSTGNVFKGIKVGTKDKVAIKIMTIKKDTRLDMWENEILMMTKCCIHENICKYYGTYYTDNEIWVCFFEKNNLIICSFKNNFKHAHRLSWNTLLVVS